MKSSTKQLPIPNFYSRKKVGQVWRVPYQERAAQALEWAKRHDIPHAAQDKLKICLMPIDCQNTFCQKDFELFVAGRSGTGAIDDNCNLIEFIYRELAVINEIDPTLDTHTAMQIFHPIFLVNNKGEHPNPFTLVSLEDVEKGVWKVNPAIAYSVAGGNYAGLQNHLLHYTRKLSEKGKYLLCVWPYHSMLGGIGHALVSGVEEALFFHNIARNSQTGYEIKGGNPLFENYSVIKGEVLTTHGDKPIGQKNERFIKKLLSYDVLIIGGQAKGHCVAWTIDDLLTEIAAKDPALAKKVYLLEDCTSAVVVRDPSGNIVADFTEQADAAFRRFQDAGMHVVRSTDPIETWPGISL